MGDRPGGRAWAAAFAGLGIAAAGGAGALAQAPANPGATAGTPAQLNPAAQTESSVRRRRAADLFSTPDPGPCPFRSSGLTFKLLGVDVAGSTSLTAGKLEDAYADMIGRDVPVGAICDIRDRLSTMLFRRGVLARVEIPEQKIVDGRIRLEVIEAKIVSVRFHGDVGPAQARVEAYLNRLRGLQPFDLDTAQRYLLLANDIPGVRVNAALRPSTAAGTGSARGAIDLDVTIARDPFAVLGAVQNTSSEALGRWSGIGRVDFNSFTRFGERTSLIGYATIGQNEQQVIQLVEEARIGSSGLFGRGSLAYGRSRPGDVLKPLNLKGDSVVGTFELDYPVVRLRRANLTLASGFDWVDQTTDFPGGGALTDDSVRIVWGRVDAAAQYLAPASVLGSSVAIAADTSVEFRKGLSGLGASKPGAPALSRVEGKPDAWVIRVEGQSGVRMDPLGAGLPLALSVRYQAQYTDKPLLSYEEQAVGDLTIGRGYDPAAVSGDRAAGAELKLQAGPVPVVRGFALAPYAFYDAARLWNLDRGSENRTIRSCGGGAELRTPYGVRVDLAYAKPLDRPYSSALTKPPARVLLQVVIAR